MDAERHPDFQNPSANETSEKPDAILHIFRPVPELIQFRVQGVFELRICAEYCGNIFQGKV